MSKMKLFCFPHAGGSASTYISWSNLISKKVELKPIEYPGRGFRAKDALCTTMEEIVHSVYETIVTMLDEEEDYILYGHSMGSLIAYEVAYKLIEKGHKKPHHIILSGGKAPQRRIKKKHSHKLVMEKFEDFVLQYGGKQTHKIFENKELKDYFIPILRSDIKIVEEYLYQKPAYLFDSNLSILIGEDDESTTWEDIKEWSEVTTKDCQFYYFKGGHFFIQENPKQVVNQINYIIDSIVVELSKPRVKTTQFEEEESIGERND